MTSPPPRARSPHRGRDDLSRFQRLQVEHFARADEAKFLWQTQDAYLAKTERALLDRVPVKSSDRLLEVGCGEGGNLQLLGLTPLSAVGVDFSHAKVSWARHHCGAARFVCADGTRLPFQDETFDVVLCRDVLHHTVDKSEVVGELIRVCRAFGRVVIIEPNGGSPIVGLLGLLVEAERELLRNSLGGVLALLDRGQVAEPDVSWAQPFPAGRVLFHYRWGLPRLSAWLAGAVLAAERLIGRLVPTERWAYMIITTVKTASGKPVVSESV
ncbi:MAG: class I SAM-dependent methyltransferase [Nitrospirae bacterium]|nr:MAG: class I SAM-dependent methyltransferase [Nitrospirota bacterium]